MSQKDKTTTTDIIAGVLKTTVAAGVLTVAAVAAANLLVTAGTPQLSPRLRGQFGRYPARYGDVAYSVAGTGPPLLLLHGLDAGRSMAEWRSAYESLADTHTTYALDWLGWGLSDPARDGYTAQDFADIVRSFIQDVIGKPTIVVAAGQGGIFAMLAAQQGANICGLALVCPVPAAYDAPSGQSRAEANLQGALNGGLLGAPVFGTAALNVLRSKKGLEKWAIEHGFSDKERALQEVKTLYVTAHQDASGTGLRKFMLGAFEVDWRETWSALAVPALVIWGRDAIRDGLDASPEWLALQPLARLEVVDDTKLLPHLESPEALVAILGRWIATLEA